MKATSLVEKSSYKLLNNSNFGNDCRNNINNCILEPLYDDLNETSYIKKFTTIFDDGTFRYFFSPEHLWEEVIQNCLGKTIALNKNDTTYEATKEYYENTMEEELDAIESFKKGKRKERKRKFQEINEKIYDCLDPEKQK